jgi:hypothetical protein
MRNSIQVQETLAFLKLELDKILVPYMDTTFSRPVMHQIKSRFFTVVKNRFPGEDFENWLRLEANQTMTRIDVKLNHDRMLEMRSEVPDWVYFVFWTFNPNFAPTKKENFEEH